MEARAAFVPGREDSYESRVLLSTVRAVTRAAQSEKKGIQKADKSKSIGKSV
jgi:hypothetical protein